MIEPLVNHYWSCFMLLYTLVHISFRSVFAQETETKMCQRLFRTRVEFVMSDMGCPGHEYYI